VNITLHNKLKKSIAYLSNSKYAIAVSGGSDSLALLYLCAELSNDNFVVVHFDHNVRDESSQEADFVEQTSKQLGLRFEKHLWGDDEKKNYSGNFYQSARIARYKFFKQVVDKYKLDGVLVAHSKTDLSETLLMRLGKGCSLKGASIFEQGVNIFGVNVFRPLLDFSRQDLQNYLSDKDITWKSDPSNKDTSKMRPRIRSILPHLESIGINLNGFNKATKYFSHANQALDYYTKKEIDSLYRSYLGYYKIESNDFFDKPLEIQIRIINNIIESNNDSFSHLPRRKKLIELLGRIENKKTTIETIDSISLEIVECNLFIYYNENTNSLESINYDKNQQKATYLRDIDKKTRYNIVKYHNLQLLPINIRNRVIVLMPKNKATNKVKVSDFTCLSE